jgi:hypothetical protein
MGWSGGQRLIETEEIPVPTACLEDSDLRRPIFLMATSIDIAAASARLRTEPPTFCGHRHRFEQCECCLELWERGIHASADPQAWAMANDYLRRDRATSPARNPGQRLLSALKYRPRPARAGANDASRPLQRPHEANAVNSAECPGTPLDADGADYVGTGAGRLQMMRYQAPDI